jgi:hypothetical protein
LKKYNAQQFQEFMRFYQQYIRLLVADPKITSDDILFAIDANKLSKRDQLARVSFKDGISQLIAKLDKKQQKEFEPQRIAGEQAIASARQQNAPSQRGGWY